MTSKHETAQHDSKSKKDSTPTPGETSAEQQLAHGHVPVAQILQRTTVVPGSINPGAATRLQRAIGNQSVSRLVKSLPAVQTKLTLGPAGDRYEQEADQVARQVVSTISARQS